MLYLMLSSEYLKVKYSIRFFWKGDEKARKAFMCEQEIKIKFSI